ncbi:Elf1p [Cyberlindnera jadinii NRRL Y-1542]|uniref:Transcription elongation factor 1 homolog n=1 Tax=Cyberlindnera jadinii (strain ATCC 18201 / CBS 1600 / BCRC 20928 / JCM 3617 / NBRC 0987 / NRRL Y-1542) TaxID=983966 RepID=A0A1E4S8M1_CYBJN|nr:Elf1-domain-containing protein [Cyberlindnera jadinii NRRL Y-1542]ODV75834.1 Elf1-domain-containing protein [Cyberlindnera jadinii NRRL Y-1542]
MGRKKSSAKPVKRVVQKLDTQFNCLFCNHEKSIICTLDKKNNLGFLYCKICGQKFQTPINALSKPVDVYTDWFDAAEAVNEDHHNGGDDEDDEDEYDDEDRVHSAGRGNSSKTAKTNTMDDGFIEDDEEEEDGNYSD